MQFSLLAARLFSWLDQWINMPTGFHLICFAVLIFQVIFGQSDARTSFYYFSQPWYFENEIIFHQHHQMLITVRGKCDNDSVSYFCNQQRSIDFHRYPLFAMGSLHLLFLLYPCCCPKWRISICKFSRGDAIGKEILNNFHRVGVQCDQMTAV